MVSLTQDLHRVKTASDTVQVKQTRIYIRCRDVYYNMMRLWARLSQLTLTITDDQAPHGLASC